MFEGGSLWKPPPLKNLLSKVLPPIQEVVKKGQLLAKWVARGLCVCLICSLCVCVCVYVGTGII